MSVVAPESILSTFTTIVWDNQGTRTVHPAGESMGEALKAAKAHRTLANRTVKIGYDQGTEAHWVRSEHLTRNHWSRIPVAEDLDSCHDAYTDRCKASSD